MSNCWNSCEGDEGSEGITSDANVAALATAEAVAETLGVAGVRMEFSPATARLVVRALQKIATGEPLASTSLREVATDLDDADDVVAAVTRMAEFDADGRIIGVFGLSQGDHPHEFTVAGRSLATWCAWDTLFLAPVLGEAAEVRSRDPETGTTIEVRVSPAGATGPEGTVVSIVFPEVDEAGTWDAARAQELFCSLVHFFEDRASAERWFAERQVPAAFLSLDEAFRLGQMRFGALIDAAQRARRVDPAVRLGAGRRPPIRATANPRGVSPATQAR